MTDTQIIEFLQDNSEFFTSNSMVAGILRSIGWMLVKLFTTAIDICQTLYDTTFGLVDITKWTGLETFLEDFKPLMEAFLFGSIVLLAFMIILGKQKQNHLLTSMLVFAVVTTSSTYLFSQVNMWTITFKDAILSGNGQTNGTELVRTYLYDLIYIDKELGGLQNMKSDKNPPQYAALTEKEMDLIDLGETLPYDKKGLSKDAKKILKKKLDFRSGQCELEEVSNGVAWTDYGNDFYYRYHFRFGTYYLSAIALLLVLIGLSYKNTRIIYELFISRILVTLKSIDMSSSKKTVRVLECIRDGYYAYFLSICTDQYQCHFKSCDFTVCCMVCHRWSRCHGKNYWSGCGNLRRHGEDVGSLPYGTWRSKHGAKRNEHSYANETISNDERTDESDERTCRIWKYLWCWKWDIRIRNERYGSDVVARRKRWKRAANAF